MTEPPPAAAPPPGVDYSRKWLALAAVGMGILLATIDGSIVNVALPTLVDAFDTTFPVVQWVVLGYLLALATLILGVGRLGDMVGKRRIYTAGFGVFTLFSMLAGLAPSIGFLIAARVAQAVGASMVLALGIAITTEAFPPTERGRALGITGSMVSIGIVLGPTLGGFLIDALSWRWIFFVNLPVGIIGTVAAWRFVPDISPRGGQRFDFLGAGVLLVGLLSLLLALTTGQELGFGDRRILLLFAVALVALVGFLVIELRTNQPMVDLSLFRSGVLSVGLSTGFITFVAIAGLLILMPFYLEKVLGFDPRTTGLLLSSTPVLLGVSAPVSGWLSDRIGTRPVAVTGLAILVAGYLIVRTLDVSTSGLGYVLTILPIGLGMGVFQSPNNSAVMGSVPPERLGITSGMLSLTRILGQIAGIAVLGALWASRVAVHAGEAFAGAATSAPPAAQVLALRETFLVVVVVMVGATVLAAWAWLRQRRGIQFESPLRRRFRSGL